VSTVDTQACYGIAPGHRMQWEEAQGSWVILYPEGMVKLNETAADILRRCDGSTPLNQIIADLENDFAESDLTPDVVELVEAALAHGWFSRR
jgi:pyrroloquinoline quinone biosynthesis protein D